MCFAPQRRALFRDLNFQKWSEPLVFLTFWLPNVLRATTACTFSTSQLPKVVRHWGALYILTSKCASRHNGVHFFDISTAKSGPTMVCFVHFHFEMCFAPQRRALFQHRNFQKWSDTAVFCTFWLRNVLRATTACNFSSLIWPAGSAPAALASRLFTFNGGYCYVSTYVIWGYMGWVPILTLYQTAVAPTCLWNQTGARLLYVVGNLCNVIIRLNGNFFGIITMLIGGYYYFKSRTRIPGPQFPQRLLSRSGRFRLGGCLGSLGCRLRCFLRGGLGAPGLRGILSPLLMVTLTS